MSPSKTSLAAGLLLLFAACSDPAPSRSVKSLYSEPLTPPKFTRDASTGLFVGVRDFPHDHLLEVPYACDDAVDLAHRFVFDQRIALLPPKRVVLAIAGSPQKRDSAQRLRELEEAGARVVRNAGAEELLDLMKGQAARAGDEGLFVLSVASHGFQQNGDAYILAASSDFGAPETALRASTIFDVAAKAKRSLIFVDACRDRVQKGGRAAGAEPASAAPHIRRMNGVHGQVIFYAAAPGQYAFDDPIAQNGVFTKAVLDGLSKASAPRGTVTVETLYTYVDREVRNWIRDNKGRRVNPATQISMEGQTGNMPLSEIWRDSRPDIRVEVDGRTVTAYSLDTRPLWRKEDIGGAVVHTGVADLDADAMYEVVVGLPDRIIVFDRDGHVRWERNSGARTLQSFAIGDLFEKHTHQIVALWNGEHDARMTVFDSDGREGASLELAAPLQRVAIGRATNMHAPRIVVATANAVMLFHPHKVGRVTPVWQRLLRSLKADAISDLRILDSDAGRRTIAVATANGTTRFTFDGKIIGASNAARWEDETRRKHRR